MNGLFKDKRKSIIDKVSSTVAIEETNFGFKVLDYILTRLLNDNNIDVIKFSPNLRKAKIENIKAFIVYAVKKVLKILKSFPCEASIQSEPVLPSTIKFVIWELCAFFWSFYKYLLIRCRVRSIFCLKIGNVLIGDLVMSDCVRSSQKNPSKLRYDKNLFKSLYKSYEQYKYGLFLFKKKKVQTLVPSHNTYTRAVMSRTIINCGGNMLYVGKFPFSIFVNKFTFSKNLPYLLNVDQFPTINDENIKVVCRYMESRITPNSKVLPYMNDNSNQNDVLQYQLYNIEINDKKINACIFLHSFADALFAFGYDSFDDIWSWLTFTIDNLLSIKKVSINIFIKPHPNIEYFNKYKTNVVRKDHDTYVYLKNQYNKYNNLHFLTPSTSNSELVKLPNFIGITHHGNVAPELAYCGVPVLASAHAPWKFCGGFLITWSTKKQYQQQLFNIGTHLAFVPDKKSLYNFVYYYYLKLNDNCNLDVYHNKFFKIAYNTALISDKEFHEKYHEIISIIKKDKVKYNTSYKYVQKLLIYSNLYRKLSLY